MPTRTLSRLRENAYTFVESTKHSLAVDVVHQTFGQVTNIEGDGLLFYESYLPTHRGEAASVEKDTFDALGAKAVYEKVFKLLHGLTTNEENFDELIRNLDKRLDVCDQILSKQKDVAGEEVTLVDLLLIPYGDLLPAAGSNVLDTKTNVTKWGKDITSRPFWITVKDGVKSVTA